MRHVLHWSCCTAQHKQDDMICLNNCVPGPVYPLSTERTVNWSCIGAGHDGVSEVCVLFVSLGHRFSLYFSFFSGGTKNDVVDGPCVQIHQLWPSIPDTWGFLHQTGKRPIIDTKHLSKLTFYLKCCMSVFSYSAISIRSYN